MRRRWALSLAIAAFAAGAAAGLFGGRFLGKSADRDGRGDPRGRFLMRTDRLAEKLDLDAEQKKKWDEIGRAASDEMARIMEETHNRTGEIRENFLPKLRGVLRPEQAEKFDEITAAWEKHGRRRRRE